jgi:hypothetical protein
MNKLTELLYQKVDQVRFIGRDLLMVVNPYQFVHMAHILKQCQSENDIDKSHSRKVYYQVNQENSIELVPAEINSFIGMHYNFVVIVNPNEIAPKVLDELRMIPGTKGNKTPIMEYVEV